MAESYLDMIFRTKKEGDAGKQTAADLKDVEKTSKSASDGLKVFGLSLTDLKSGFDMVTGVVGPALEAMKGTIDAASDLNETVSKSQVVFGDAAAAVEDMGNSAAAAMGMSKNEAIAAAATYGNLFVSMGMGKQAAADMSINIVKLAGDLASFNNIPVGDALEKLRAGLTGETEPLKSLGINISAAAVAQEALSSGLLEGGKALGAAEKAQATYALILRQTTTAQGDFARTSEGAANQQRILEAEMKNVAAQIGKGLLPAYNKLLQVGTQVMENIELFLNWTEKMNVILQLHSKELAKTGISWNDYTQEMIRAKLRSAENQYQLNQFQDDIKNSKGNVTDLMLAWGFYTKAQLEAAEGGDVLTESLRNVNKAALDTYISTDADTKAYAALRAALSDTNISIEDQERALADATTASGAYVDTFPETENSLDELTKKYGGLTDALIFNRLATGMSRDAAMALGIQMGILNPTVIAAQGAMDDLNKRYPPGTRDSQAYKNAAEALAAAIAKLQDKTITVITKYYDEYNGSMTPEQRAAKNPQPRGGPGGGPDPIPNSLIPGAGGALPNVPIVQFAPVQNPGGAQSDEMVSSGSGGRTVINLGPVTINNGADLDTLLARLARMGR